MAPSDDPSTRLSKAIFIIQSRLIDLPRCSERQLLAAGSLLSLIDYDDIATERSLSRLCGFPLCPNPLPPSPPRKGRYRISLRDHHVYDLQEANMFCSDSCLISSKAFSATLHPDPHCYVPATASRVSDILRLFEDEAVDDSRVSVMDADSREQKKLRGDGDLVLVLSKLTIRDKSEVEMPMEEWVGPSNAIEGYVPQRERERVSRSDSKPGTTSQRAFKKPAQIVDDSLSDVNEKMKSCSVSSPRGANSEAGMLEDEDRLKREVQYGELNTSLRKPGSKERKRGVRWADEEQVIISDTGDVEHEVREISSTRNGVDDVKTLRVVSAEACASALIQASEAVASGECEVEDAVNEAGIEILRPAHDDDAVETDTEDEALAFERSYRKWPRKPVLLDTDLFEVEDSWHDASPEGFNLTLSTFGTTWKALFGWITCSSVAYIYGRSEDSEDEFLFVNGREYPRKITSTNGRSTEIKKTLAGCVARALPQVISDLRLPIPISTIEKAMGDLLETMTFMEAIPSFKTKEWHVIVLLFLDAISLFRIPTLSTHMANKKVLLHKVIDASKIRRDEYGTMKDLMIPLGRLPQFSVQSGA